MTLVDHISRRKFVKKSRRFDIIIFLDSPKHDWSIFEHVPNLYLDKFSSFAALKKQRTNF